MNQPEQRIPTVFAILFLVVSVGLLVFFIRKPQIFQPRADVSTAPGNIQISNITDTELVVSFTTPKAIAAQIKFGKTLQDGTLLFDDRDDVGGSENPFTIHYFTVSSLTPGQSYVFSVQTGSQIYDNNGQGYPAKTSPYTGESQQLDPIQGSIVDSAEDPANSLITLSVSGASPLTTISKPTGNFLLPLSDIRTSDLTNAFHFNGDEILTLTITTSSFKTSSVQIPFANRNITEPIQVGQLQAAVNPSVAPTSQVDTLPQTSSFDNANSAGAATLTPAFTYPKDGDFVIDPRPLLQGNGNTGQTVLIQLGALKGQATIDASGNWRYQPTANLSVGKHTAIVTFQTNQVTDTTITHNFEILASGSQVQQSATPSPTLITQTPVSITPFLTQQPTVAPLAKTGTVEPLWIGLIGGFVILIGGVAISLF